MSHGYIDRARIEARQRMKEAKKVMAALKKLQHETGRKVSLFKEEFKTVSDTVKQIERDLSSGDELGKQDFAVFSSGAREAQRELLRIKAVEETARVFTRGMKTVRLDAGMDRVDLSDLFEGQDEQKALRELRLEIPKIQGILSPKELARIKALQDPGELAHEIARYRARIDEVWERARFIVASYGNTKCMKPVVDRVGRALKARKWQELEQEVRAAEALLAKTGLKAMIELEEALDAKLEGYEVMYDPVKRRYHVKNASEEARIYVEGGIVRVETSKATRRFCDSMRQVAQAAGGEFVEEDTAGEEAHRHLERE